MNYCIDVVLLFGARSSPWTYIVSEEVYEKIDFSSIVKVDFGNKPTHDSLGFVIKKFKQTDAELDTRFGCKEIKSVVMYRSFNDYQCYLFTKLLRTDFSTKMLGSTIDLFIDEKMILALAKLKGTYTTLYTLNKKELKEYKKINRQQEEIIRMLEDYSTGLTRSEIRELKLSMSSLNTLVKNNVVEESQVFYNKNIRLNYERKPANIAEVITNGLVVGTDFEHTIINVIKQNILANKQTVIVCPCESDVEYWFEKISEYPLNIAKYTKRININDKMLVIKGLESNMIQVLVTTPEGLFFPFHELKQVILLNQESSDYQRKSSPLINYNFLLDQLDEVNVLKLSSTPSINEYYRVGGKNMIDLKPNVDLVEYNPNYEQLFNDIMDLAQQQKRILIMFMYDEKDKYQCPRCRRIQSYRICGDCREKCELLSRNKNWFTDKLSKTELFQSLGINPVRFMILNEKTYTFNLSHFDEVFVLGCKYITNPRLISGFINEYSYLTNISVKSKNKVIVPVTKIPPGYKLDSYKLVMESILSNLARYEVHPFKQMVKIYFSKQDESGLRYAINRFIELLRPRGIKYFYSDYTFISGYEVCGILPVVIESQQQFDFIVENLPYDAEIVHI